MVGPPVTVTVLVPPAVPLSVTPAPVKPLTGLLNTAVKLIGKLLVGSAWPAAWLIVTVGGLALETVTVTGAEAVRRPAASRATAVKVCGPLLALVVFHEVEYGGAVTSGPAFTPSTRNWTPATPTSSEAVAVTLVVPPTFAPDPGDAVAVGQARACVHPARAVLHDIWRVWRAARELSAGELHPYELLLGAVDGRIAPQDGRRRTLHRVDRGILVADHHTVGGASQRRRLEPDLPEHRVRAEDTEMDAGAACLLHTVVHRLRPVLVVSA